MNGWSKTIDQMGKDLQSGKIKTSDLNESFVTNTYNQLTSGAGTGYGKGWQKMQGTGLPNPRVTKMKQNLYKFSAAKNAAMLQDINSKLYDGNRLKSFSELKDDLNKLNIQYNDNWLQAEYQTARQSGYMAQQWEAYQQNTKLFPNLKYKTQEDGHVRPEHQALDGIIAPVDGEFWSRYYPPNGWRCRCYVVQTAELATRDIPANTQEVKPEFQINVGKSGQVFNESSKSGHQYFALAAETPGWQKRFEMSKQEGPYETLHKAPKANVDVSIYADEKDLSVNYEKAVQMTDQLDIDVKIRPHTNLPGWKNPEYMLNGIVGDLYQGDIQLGFDKKRKQIKDFIKKQNDSSSQKVSEEYAIAFDISGIKNIDYSVPNVINGKFKSGKSLQFVILLKGSKSVKINRSDTLNQIEEKYAQIAKAK